MISFSDFDKCATFIEMDKESCQKPLSVLISTDTRTLKENHVFLAITGDKYNALEFLEKVIEKNCKFVIYTKNKKNDLLIQTYKNKIHFIATADSVQFLQEITNILSMKFQARGGTLIAISGSNGKTTTKEMLDFLLRSVHEKTICTQKNNNNHIGVPLTLLQIEEDTEYAIIELGSNHPGEIKTLCEIVEPLIGVVTNIGDTHLEFFKNRANVYLEEGFLAKTILNSKAEKKKLFVNADDDFLKEHVGKDGTVSYGQDKATYNFNMSSDEVVINYNNHEYCISNKFITGRHNFFNLALAYCIACEVDSVNSTKYLEMVKEFKPTKNRSQWLNFNEKKIFLDAYNANPSSMLAAIDGFVEKVGANSNYCLILGDMNELGEDAASFHQKLANKLQERGYKNFIFVGKFSQDYNLGCDSSGEVYPNTGTLSKVFKLRVLNNFDSVFIKGSRSLQLESLVDIN